MARTIQSFIAASLAAGIILISGCHTDCPNCPPPLEGYYITTETSKSTYYLGDTVHITVAATNNSEDPFETTLCSSCQLGYEVLDAEGNLVFSPFACYQVLTPYALPAHETDIVELTWNLKDPNDLVATGIYQIYGALGQCRHVVGDTVTVTVQ